MGYTPQRSSIVSSRPSLVFLLAALMALIGMPLSSGPAGAIGYDHGWTHWANNFYPDPPTNPECQPAGGGQGCHAWSDDAAQGVDYPNVNVNILVGGATCCTGGTFDGRARDSLNQFVNPVVAPAIGNDNSPYLLEGNTGGTVTVGAIDLGGLCGRTDAFWINAPPVNHGCCQQKTISSANIYLNTRRGYRDDGVFGGDVCELRWTYNHEFGHSLGPGHTVDPAQTMFSTNVAVFGAQTGDRNGVHCIYQVVNCG